MSNLIYPPILAVDFFCGAGGMTNGLIAAGFHVIAGIDNQPLCEPTYIQNTNADGSHPKYLCLDIFPRSKAHPGGQQHLISEELDLSLREYRKEFRTKKLKLVFAICAPCQPFTKITKIQMSERRQYKRATDSNLLLTTTRLISEFRPDAIICENVEGLIANADKSVLLRFQRSLRALDYRFEAKVVNASRFGVPQNRRRTIGIGIDRRRYSQELEILDHDPKQKSIITVEQTIGHLPPIAAGEVHPAIPNHRARGLSPLNLKRISCALPGESNAYLHDTPYGDLSLACHRRLKKKYGVPSFTDAYTRMRSNDVSPTITTKSISITNGRFGHFDRKQNRALSPREAALLQTFPPRYRFFPEDNIEFTAAVIGNAVPPRLAKFFGSQILSVIER
jgi:DNA (cytosine-5)-methyltransferase 1